MTAITDISTSTGMPEAPHMISGERWLTRSAQRLGGIALVLAAIGLWIAPGAGMDADVALFKLGVSVADLGPAEVHGQMARLWTVDGALVAEVAMSDPDLRRSLMGALRDAGKL